MSFNTLLNASHLYHSPRSSRGFGRLHLRLGRWQTEVSAPELKGCQFLLVLLVSTNKES